MSKKIFLDTPTRRPAIERIDEREVIHKQRLSGSVGETQRTKARKKREVKAQARLNRDTTRRERQYKKMKRKSVIDYAPGDLVYHRRRPEIPMLVMSIEVAGGGWDDIVEVMLGADMIRYKAVNLRKCE